MSNSFVTQAPLLTKFAKEEYWSGMSVPSPGIETASPALAGRFFTTEPPQKPDFLITETCYSTIISLYSPIFKIYIYIFIFKKTKLAL